MYFVGTRHLGVVLELKGSGHSCLTSIGPDVPVA